MKAVCIGGPLDNLYYDGKYYEMYGKCRFHIPIEGGKDIDPMERESSEHWYTIKSFVLFGICLHYWEYDNLIGEYTDSSLAVRKVIALFKGEQNDKEDER